MITAETLKIYAGYLDPFGWSLLHLLWQGTILAFALRAFLFIARNASAQIRYAVSCATLVLMLLCPISTFLYLTANPVEQPHIHSPAIRNPAFLIDHQQKPFSSFLGDIAIATDHAMPWILAIWITGVLALLTRLILAGVAAERLKTTSLIPVPENLLSLAKQVAERIHVKQTFHVFASNVVIAPSVIGWLKPVILFPIASLTGLTTDQWEVLLAHELAHIHRRDYLVNAFQVAIEALLFYHPAVWWISNQIRYEREHCCDDVAVAVTNSPLIYAKTLYQLAEQSYSPTTPQLMLGSNGGQLTMRIRRLLTGNESAIAPRGTTLSLLAIAVLALSALFLVFSATGRRATAQTTASGPAQAISEDEARQHLLSHQDPATPPIAQSAHVGGDVHIAVVIDPNGKITSARVISGPPMLVGAAIDSVIHWQFTPFSVNGVPSSATTTLTVPFVLANGGPAAKTTQPPDLSCTFYSNNNVPSPGTCEAGESSKEYSCRNNENNQQVQNQVGCERKVQGYKTWELQQKSR